MEDSFDGVGYRIGETQRSLIMAYRRERHYRDQLRATQYINNDQEQTEAPPQYLRYVTEPPRYVSQMSISPPVYRAQVI